MFGVEKGTGGEGIAESEPGCLEITGDGGLEKF